MVIDVVEFDFWSCKWTRFFVCLFAIVHAVLGVVTGVCVPRCRHPSTLSRLKRLTCSLVVVRGCSWLFVVAVRGCCSWLLFVVAVCGYCSLTGVNFAPNLLRIMCFFRWSILPPLGIVAEIAG